MLVLVDGDLVAYRCAASAKEGDDFTVVTDRIDTLMNTIIRETSATSFAIFLTGSDNYRKIINPEYKANRKDQAPPIYLQDAREYLVINWKAKLADGCEADDMLGIYQTDDTVIASLDKDLLMIPGNHYSWAISTATWSKDAKEQHITLRDGNLHFWKQMLIGDKTDNIFGVNQIGPVKSKKLLDHFDTDQECLDVVLSLYEEDYHRFAMNAFCLWIKRTEELQWHEEMDLVLPSDLQREVITMYESMKCLTDAL